LSHYQTSLAILKPAQGNAAERKNRLLRADYGERIGSDQTAGPES
jgi:hypothetical protein